MQEEEGRHVKKSILKKKMMDSGEESVQVA